MSENAKCSVVIPGNTKTGMTSDKIKKFACNFQITLNCEINNDPYTSFKQLIDKYNKAVSYLRNLKYRYFISCDEINKKGFHHIHIFIQFDKARKLSLKKLQGAHLEICRGSVEDNINYIKKDGKILDEVGTPKLMYKASIRDILNHKNNDDLLDLDLKYVKCINEIKNNSLIWNQPIFNTCKDIYFINNYDKNIINDCKCINIDSNGKFQGLQKNILIDLTDYIINDTNLPVDENDDYDIHDYLDINIIPLIQKLNKPLNCVNQTYYPADIKKIVFIYPNQYKRIVLDWYINQKFYFKNHDVHISISDKENYLNYEPEFDSDEDN